MNTNRYKKAKYNLKKFFVPHPSNGHYPFSVRTKTIALYLVIIIAINLLGTALLPSFSKVGASNIDPGQLVSLANQERSALGLGTLTVDQRLVNAAHAKGLDMLEKDYWAHFGPNGESPWQFIKAAGYSYQYAGENLARDFSSTTSVHQAWMNSPTHKANIVKAEYTNIGISVVEGDLNGEQTILVVQMFGTPIGSTAKATTPTTTKTEAKSTNEATNEAKNAGLPPAVKPGAPKIIEPKSGDIINKSKITIKGNADDNTRVDVFDGNTKLGSLTAEGGIFTVAPESDLRDGEHVLSATSTNSYGLTSSKSNEVKINIDTSLPVLEEKNLSITSTDVNPAFVFLNFKVNSDKDVKSAVLIVNGEKYELDMTDKNEVVFSKEIKLKIEDIDKDDFSAQIVVTDNAGNETRKEISKEDILGTFDINQANVIENQGLDQAVDLSVLNLSDLKLSMKQIINFLFVLFLIVVFSLDIFYIWKDKHTRDLWSIRHYPLMIFLIFITLVNAGGKII
ncbi:hypothetical protein KC660_00915 [Candidatus Dojkabacteria bacterium]|uniref:SCP domain-containing protein n=1 Tax=Candidatus Dojkabacteria bacterium TaxID=2099670 RepID=A0A955L318_9BACT|nr:hypothetical protein [Candidatus Dojkabacteria bacterium]